MGSTGNDEGNRAPPGLSPSPVSSSWLTGWRAALVVPFFSRVDAIGMAENKQKREDSRPSFSKPCMAMSAAYARSSACDPDNQIQFGQ